MTFTLFGYDISFTVEPAAFTYRGWNIIYIGGVFSAHAPDGLVTMHRNTKSDIKQAIDARVLLAEECARAQVKQPYAYERRITLVVGEKPRALSQDDLFPIDPRD